MKETFKDVEINGRKFRINKFDALTGSYIVYTVLTQVLPMGLGKNVDGLSDSVPVNAPVMSKATFTELQKDCLRACSENRPAGDTIIPVPIIMRDGRWGVDDLANDATTVLLLTIQVLGYNLQSFFDASALTEFKKTISQLNLSNA